MTHLSTTVFKLCAYRLVINYSILTAWRKSLFKLPFKLLCLSCCLAETARLNRQLFLNGNDKVSRNISPALIINLAHTGWTGDINLSDTATDEV